MRLSYNTFSASTAPAEEIIAAARSAGFEGIGLFVEHFRQLADNQSLLDGLTCTGIYVHFHDGSPQTSASLGELMTQAWSLLRAPVITLPTSAFEGRMGEFASGLDTILSNNDGRLALEPLYSGLSAVSALTSLADASDIVGDRPQSLSLVLDVAHVEWGTLVTLPQETLEKASVVHLSDRSELACSADGNRLLGDGCLDFRSLRSHFETHGFSGWWESEVLNTPGGEDPYLCMSRMRKALQPSTPSPSTSDTPSQRQGVRWAS